MRAQCVARRLQRESARTAPIGERRHRGRAQGAAGRHGAMMARSRGPLVVAMSGAFRSAWACRRVSHLPDLTPIDFALFTRATPGGQFRRQQPPDTMRPRISGEPLR